MLALDAIGVMEPLTREDPTRSWRGRFVPIHSQCGASFAHGWTAEFDRLRSRAGLLANLQSLSWPRPESVQVLIHDQDNDCFGLWMIRDGRLEAVALPDTRRLHAPVPKDRSYPPHPGDLVRTDRGRPLPEQTAGELRDHRPAW